MRTDTIRSNYRIGIRGPTQYDAIIEFGQRVDGVLYNNSQYTMKADEDLSRRGHEYRPNQVKSDFADVPS